MSDIWEQAVETYLATDRGLLLSPQYMIGKPGEWEAYPDFLAVSFPERQAWIVEVTISAKSLNHRIKQFDESGQRLRTQLIEKQIIRDGDVWNIGFWAFVPDADCNKLNVRLKDASINLFKVTALEETIKPSMWGTRFR